MSKQAISTKPYKGVRDFYPKDWMMQKWIFWKMAEVCERYGYENYNASILEASELYEAKSGEEIVQNETYNLIDRGDRRVTLRPEMTPTVARMVAQRSQGLPKPVRWYSIPNLFRYERPQRGRLREHFQLNVDIFGVESIDADIEVISVGASIMKNLGAQDSEFKILINNRKIINAVFTQFTQEKDTVYALSKLIDKKKKISPEEFAERVAQYLGKDTAEFISIVENSSLDSLQSIAPKEAWTDTTKLIAVLESQGHSNVVFDLTLMRGFDYYTDVVFEFFDIHPENNRSMFGGGRYNDLLDIFGMEKVPGVGFGMGDVTAYNFLAARGLLPELESLTQVAVLPFSATEKESGRILSEELRKHEINCEFDFTNRTIDKKMKAANTKGIPYVVLIGQNELASSTYTLRNMANGEEQALSAEEIVAKLSA